MGLLDGKTALVTGATRGIGRAIALKFASEGADIAFTYRSQEEAALTLTAEIEAMGVRVKAYRSDAASFEDAHNVVADAKETFGHIDILVNNAGITKDGLMMRMDEASWDAVIGTNLKSAFNFIHACTPIMARQRSGSIINMSSVVGVSGNAGQCNYSASKGGLVALTKSAARELGARGVRVNAVAPGFIKSKMTDVLTDDVKNRMLSAIPMGKFGEVEDVANAVAFLASDSAAYITGQVISVNGGMLMP